jgi:hypothetical protein
MPLEKGCVTGALGATVLIESTSTRVAVAETQATTIPSSRIRAVVGFTSPEYCAGWNEPV